jgi:hypothetical protein
MAATAGVTEKDNEPRPSAKLTAVLRVFFKPLEAIGILCCLGKA